MPASSPSKTQPGRSPGASQLPSTASGAGKPRPGSRDPRDRGRHWRDYLADGAGLLGAKVQRLVLLPLVELPQVLFLLLVHDDVHPSDGLPHNSDLGEFGGGTTGYLRLSMDKLNKTCITHLSDAELGELGLEIIQLLGQLLLLASAQLGALDLAHSAV